MRKRVVSLMLLILALALSSATSAYSDAIDYKINHYVSLGGQLNEKQVQLELKQQVLLIQKKQLDAESALLTKDQGIYNNSANQYNTRANEHNRKIGEASEKCQSFGPKKNLDQLAQAADIASAGLTNFSTNNPDARQQEEYARRCNASIKQVNSRTLQMASDKSSLLNQQGDLVKQSADYNAKAAAWNLRETEIVSALNNVYQHINSWQNDTEDFMQSDEFQAQIGWSHTDKVCATPDFVGTSQERMTKISNYIFACLNTVESVRKHFYANYDEYLKKWYPNYYKALRKYPAHPPLY